MVRIFLKGRRLSFHNKLFQSRNIHSLIQTYDSEEFSDSFIFRLFNMAMQAAMTMPAERIEDKVRLAAALKPARVLDYFKDFDRLRAGTITSELTYNPTKKKQAPGMLEGKG